MPVIDCYMHLLLLSPPLLLLCCSSCCCLLLLKLLLSGAAGAAGAAGPVTRDVLEGCVGVVALALAVVMAGSGHLDTLKLLRGE